MKGTKYFILAAAALTLAACSNDDELNDNGPVAAQVTAGIDNNVVTRATGSTWESGDLIGISTVSTTATTGGTSYTNMKYVTNNGDGNFTHDGGEASGMFFQDASEVVTFRAYYPFQGTEKSVPEVSTITTNDQSAQKKFDFMFATGATASKSAPTIKFNNQDNNGTDARFKHMMTRLILNITTDANSGFDATDISDASFACTLSGIKHSGTFDTTNGTATATGTATDDWVITNYTTVASNVRSCTLILYPQESASLTFKATIDNQTYTSTAFTPAFAASTSYSYDIVIKKTGVTVSDCTIEDWSTGTGGSFDATMN